MNEIYEALCAPFESTYTLLKGGVELQYLTLEQVVTRLNQTLGVDGWDFEVKARGQDETHCWAHGRLTVYFERRTVVREQMGECGITRGMAVGDSAKGAASDSLKKCASLIGVGLYSAHKTEVEQATRAATAPPVLSAPVRAAARVVSTGGFETVNTAARMEPARSYSEVWQDAPAEEESEIGCADCGSLIQPWRRKDGTTWSAQQVADYSKQKFGRTTCWSCGKKATG